jgi:D-sedoheptulose 7-phosphate isomerase
MTGFAEKYRETLLETLKKVDSAKVEEAIRWLVQARAEDRQVFVCGNGGSASTASHFVCDMVKGASYLRDKKFRIMALTDGMATISAYANDVSYDAVFVEPLRNFARPGDILIAISGSGNSPNVLRAVEFANSEGLKTIGLTGRNGGKLGPLSQLEINVPDVHMGRIEDGHMVVCHMLAYRFMEE